jgi:HD-like signal output (HDOD) protein
MQISPTSLINSVSVVPTMRTVALETIRLCSEKDLSIPFLLKVISSDQSLSAQILRLANMSYYNYPGMITSLDRAAVILGFELLKEVVLSVSLSTIYKGLPENSSFHLDLLWKHSLLTALTMKIIGENFDSENKDILYMGGLLHDFGKLILIQSLGEEYSLLIEKSKQENTPLHLLERQYFGFNHADIVGDLLKKWNLPSGIEAMGKYHHFPSEYKDEDKVGSWVKFIHLGNIISHSILESKKNSNSFFANEANIGDLISISKKEIQQLCYYAEKAFKEQKDYLRIFESNDL